MFAARDIKAAIAIGRLRVMELLGQLCPGPFSCSRKAIGREQKVQTQSHLVAEGDVREAGQDSGHGREAHKSGAPRNPLCSGNGSSE